MSRYAHTDRMFKIMMIFIKSVGEYCYGFEERVAVRRLEVQAPIERELPSAGIEMVYLSKR
jgi:hypothetical protein